jgi:RNA polymerase sigma factor (sigma-70 family)
VESAPLSATATATLVAHHDRFLAFLQKRVGDREVAEEILQAAFVRGVERGGALRDDENAVAWFFRLLRNALADHWRGQALERRHFVAQSSEASAPDDEELHRTICACVDGLLGTLKPEYAEALRRVDLGGASVADYAASAGVTANNASVRLHRARKALHERLVRACGTCTEHGCLDCHCKEPS